VARPHKLSYLFIKASMQNVILFEHLILIRFNCSPFGLIVSFTVLQREAMGSFSRQRHRQVGSQRYSYPDVGENEVLVQSFMPSL
jgi:hypothetical protein